MQQSTIKKAYLRSWSPTKRTAEPVVLRTKQWAAVIALLGEMIVAPQMIRADSKSTSPAIMGNSLIPVSVPPTILFCRESKRWVFKFANLRHFI
jgi:hypothetical protein